MLEQLKPNPKTIVSDLIAGLTVSMVNLAELMGYAMVAGVNPIYGLYSGIVAPIVGALTAGSAFMMITLTNETALMTAAMLDSLDNWTIETVFAFTVLVGLFVLAFALLKVSKLLRFVSESVMTGFITGTAVLLILGQLPELTGYESEVDGNKIVETVDWLLNPTHWDLPTLIIGLLTIGAIMLFERTRAHKFALVMGLVLASLVALIPVFGDVHLVGDVAEIPRGLPLPTLPDFSQILELIVPALSLAILCVIVSAGVSQNYPNPDGSRGNPDQDFMGVGLGNIVGGFFQGLPVTGSLSRTAVGVGAGAQSRWGNIFSGLILAALLLTIAGLAEYIPETALAGLLIFVGVEAINQQRVGRAWNTHIAGRIAMVLTFLLTLVIDLQYAVYAGVLISLLLYIYSASQQVKVLELAPTADKRFEERELPDEYPSNRATVIQTYAAPFFAAIDKVAESLPSAENTQNAVVILTGRGRDEAIDTFLTWLQQYSAELERGGNRLMLAEVGPNVMKQLEQTGIMDAIGGENVFAAEPVLGESIHKALEVAEEWMAREKEAEGEQPAQDEGEAEDEA
jgi:SulP family sulfate permease